MDNEQECFICLDTNKPPYKCPHCTIYYHIECMDTFIQKTDKTRKLPTKCPQCTRQIVRMDFGISCINRGEYHQNILVYYVTSAYFVGILLFIAVLYNIQYIPKKLHPFILVFLILYTYIFVPYFILRSYRLRTLSVLI